MRTIKETIDREVKRKNLTKKEFAERIGMTEAGFYRLLKHNDMKLSTLEEMGKVLEIPVEKFFDNDEKTIQPKQKENLVFNYELNEWQSKERHYKETIQKLLNTITELSLGKRKGLSLA
jgi:transcriptional regulator with XRE-family HTH domain